METAKTYLKETKKSGSAKYIFQAGQILDSNPGSWWNNPIKLVYIVPDKTSFNTKKTKIDPERKIRVISIEDIKEKLDPNEYEDWLKSILDNITWSQS